MNYPKGVKNNNTENYIKFDNRGMGLESDINLTNQYYIDKGIAYIYKKPTPIQVTKVDYKNNSMIIKEAYFKEPSTTDYNGLYKGMYIDFEAKETTSKTSFPLANIHKHQINHIKNIANNGGIVFLIVRFVSLDKNFILMGKDFIDFLNNNDRKSIPLDYFEEKGSIVDISYMPRLDYLKVIDKILGGTTNGK
ncbi:MAG: Holliday junction resolvase RecU [Bacilli bacterium]|nr:Holliday junction resolvase RecU [Bacilli bacterium]MBR4672034.1 Holliday junction resolvase RecU [Bacilli bacterium]